MFAYAKINLGLRILRKREDGFHDIETVLHRIDLCDEITLGQSSQISLDCDEPGIPSDERNLCVRAALLLRQFTGTDRGARIVLKKKIPVGAGLGGGSSDAAATLLGLLGFWNVTITESDLRGLALQLGSDVPYFLKEGSAYATGRGDILDHFTLALPYWIVTVFPNVNISTAWAYEKSDINHRTSDPGHRTSHISLKSVLLDHLHDPPHLISLLRNDFEPLILRTHEPVARLKQKLYAAGAEYAQLSGSGSSIYGLFSAELRARNTLRELGGQYPVFITPPSFQPERNDWS